MKTIFLLFTICAVGMAYGQSDLKSQVSEVLKNYSKAGDDYDGATLQKLLHEQHRVVLYDGSSDPFIVDKTTYIAKVEAREWGGDKRNVKVFDVMNVDGVNVTAKAILDGDKASMESLFSLVKVNDEWLIVQELVKATFK